MSKDNKDSLNIDLTIDKRALELVTLIKNIVKETPNDADLGSEIRKLMSYENSMF